MLNLSCDGDHLRFPMETKKMNDHYSWMFVSIKFLNSQNLFIHFHIGSYIKTLPCISCPPGYPIDIKKKSLPRKLCKAPTNVIVYSFRTIQFLVSGQPSLISNQQNTFVQCQKRNIPNILQCNHICGFWGEIW